VQPVGTHIVETDTTTIYLPLLGRANGSMQAIREDPA
jgi:hypothetical protein